MLKFAANLTMFYNGKPLKESIPAAAKAGFKAVEYMFPYELEPEAVKKLLEDNGLVQALFNAPPGNWAAGDRGLAAVAGRDDEFKASVEKAIAYATVLPCPKINVMGGIAPEGEDPKKTIDRMIERYSWAADQFAKHNIMALIEHINTFNMPGYFASTVGRCMEIVKGVNKPNFKLQFDAFHAQRMTGEVVATMRANWQSIGHIQIADNPDRHQPGTGEMNYPFIFKEMDKLGYNGWIGLEYVPEPKMDESLASLAWVKEMGYSL